MVTGCVEAGAGWSLQRGGRHQELLERGYLGQAQNRASGRTRRREMMSLVSPRIEVKWRSRSWHNIRDATGPVVGEFVPQVDVGLLQAGHPAQSVEQTQVLLCLASPMTAKSQRSCSLTTAVRRKGGCTPAKRMRRSECHRWTRLGYTWSILWYKLQANV
jgi:hypothetical protein